METETETPTRTDEKLAERRLAQLARHLPSSALGTLAGLKTATPDALQRLNEALLDAFALLDAEGDAAHAGLAASAHADVEAEIARRPVRPSLAAAGARVPGSPTARSVLAQRTATGTRATVLTASGSPVESAEDLADAFSRAVGQVRHLPDGSHTSILSARWTYPEERRLTANDAAVNAQKIDAVTSLSALTAAGGICNPVSVSYDMPLFSSADRPIRDALPAFQANRGGLRFLSTPTLTSVGAAGTTIWTAATDANPGTATKPTYAIQCGQELEIFVNAIPTRVRVGNLTSMFYPEMVAALMGLVEAASARVADNQLYTVMAAASTAVSTGPLLGASRDFLASLDQAAAAYRFRHRIPRSTQLRAVLPDWLKDMVRADLVREMAHGQDVADAFSLTDAQVNSLLTARGISPIWHMDGQPAGAQSGINFALQGFGPQAPGALNDWPRVVDWLLFAEGTFLLLDGGTIDIGLVRDSVLNATNDHELFTERFENVAFRGVESLRCITALRANGLSAGTVSTSTY